MLIGAKHTGCHNMSQDIPSDPNDRWQWIKFQLHLRKTSLAQIAREMGVTRNAPLQIPRKPYPRMEQAIADKLGISVQLLWPERYNADAEPLPRRQDTSHLGETNVSTKNEPGKGQDDHEK